MNYIDVAENECLLIIVLGMMLISQMSEDEVEVPCRLASTPLT